MDVAGKRITPRTERIHTVATSSVVVAVGVVVLAATGWAVLTFTPIVGKSKVSPVFDWVAWGMIFYACLLWIILACYRLFEMFFEVEGVEEGSA